VPCDRVHPLAEAEGRTALGGQQADRSPAAVPGLLHRDSTLTDE
jgi:hypothetical protein